MIKAELNRVAVIVKDVEAAAKEFEEMFGITFYGPYRDDHVGVDVALPRHGGFEMMSPNRPDDGVMATQKLAEKGEGITGIAMRVDDLDEMKAHLAKFGLEPDLEFSHGQMREMIFYASEKTHGVEIAINEFPDANGCAIEVARDMGYDPR